MKPITIHPGSALIGAGLLAAVVVGLSATTPQRTKLGSTPAVLGPTLTPEQQEILSHLSIVYLDDGQGGMAKTIRASGVNVQVVNGVGVTETANSVGNIIVGYSEQPSAAFDRSGSHNLVGGVRNEYAAFGGLLLGRDNKVAGNHSSILGGKLNHVSGGDSAILGGDSNSVEAGLGVICAGDANRITGNRNVIVGGQWNLAEDARCVLVGGAGNTASGAQLGVVVGGGGNTVSASRGVVVGGRDNVATASWATAVGGYANTASGLRSTVSGGASRSALGDDDWAAGTIWQDQ